MAQQFAIRDNSGRWHRIWVIPTGLVMILLVAVILSVCLSQPSPIEKRFIGIWTWKDAPGEMVMQFRNDGTMRGIWPLAGRVSFERWWIEDDVFFMESSPRNTIGHLTRKHLLRHNFTMERCPLRHHSDGSVSFVISSGKERVLIPWDGELASFLKNAD